MDPIARFQRVEVEPGAVDWGREGEKANQRLSLFALVWPSTNCVTEPAATWNWNGGRW